jgi:hypothetical protein
MFLIGGGKVGISVIDLNTMQVLDDMKLDDGDLDFNAEQGMRVVYDETHDRYAISHTTSACNGCGFEFGMSLISIEENMIKVHWTRQFLADVNATLTGHESHPYALTIGNDDSTYVIGGLAVIFDENGVEQCQGRILAVSPDSGDVQFDRRFTSTEKDTNIECYGIQTISRDGGYILTCGTGVEPELHPKDSDKSKTWRVLVHRTDSLGQKLWENVYTTNEDLQNNAGEYIIATRDDDGYAIFVDSQTWGPDSTGGNFAIMRLDPDHES